MRAILDTNVVLAGLLWHGPPHALLQHARAGTISLVTSPALLAELAHVIAPPPLPQPVCRDPDDDEVLALATAAKVEPIVSGDNDLLSLGSFEGVSIVVPAEAVVLIEATYRTW